MEDRATREPTMTSDVCTRNVGAPAQHSTRMPCFGRSTGVASVREGYQLGGLPTLNAGEKAGGNAG